MNTIPLDQQSPPLQDAITEVMEAIELIQSSRGFIEANTIVSSLQEMQQKHIIPVFVRDNEPVISHCEFIETTMQAVAEHYPQETILSPNIRLSHPTRAEYSKPRISQLKSLQTQKRLSIMNVWLL